MTTSNPTPAAKAAPINAAERDALLQGLADLKKRGLTVRYGPRSSGKKTTVRFQVEMTCLEHHMLQTTRHAAGCVMRRPISSALLMRVGLSYLTRTCTEALKEPVAAERLRQDILRCREERLGEHGKAVV
jgi:hypothetical protein